MFNESYIPSVDNFPNSASCIPKSVWLGSQGPIVHSLQSWGGTGTVSGISSSIAFLEYVASGLEVWAGLNVQLDSRATWQIWPQQSLLASAFS